MRLITVHVHGLIIYTLLCIHLLTVLICKLLTRKLLICIVLLLTVLSCILLICAILLTRIALLGEHPLFERLKGNAGRTGIAFTDRPDASTQACLIAPDNKAPHCPTGCLSILLQPAEGICRLDELDADLVLVTPPRGALMELVATRASAEQQQAVASALKALRQAVVVSRGQSLLAALLRAANAAPDDQCAAMEAASLSLAEQGFCYRTSDIDLLAVEVLGYPRHRGGPHRQATLSAPATSETSP